MKKAMLIAEGEVKTLVSTGQPVRRSSGGNLVGMDPSRPGDPPRVVTSRLKNSITHEVERDGKDIVGRVGSDVPYARRLELGFTGPDSLGRPISTAPRPYLRPGLKNRLRQIAQILGVTSGGR